MSALPPDAPRLRAILRYLDQQIAESETVATYLRLQRDAVRDALARTGGPAPQQPPPRRPAGLPTFTGNGSRPKTAGFAVERQPTAVGPEPIHTADCPHPGMMRPITAQDARAALLDPMVQSCPFCRPDTELGIDSD